MAGEPVSILAPEAEPQLPPDLMAALAAGVPEGAPGEGPLGSPSEMLDDLIEMFKAHPYMQTESDPEDISVLQSIVAQLTKLKAKQMREVDAAMGVSAAQRGMRRGFAQA